MLVGPGEPPLLSACKYVTPKKPGWGDVPKPARSSPLGEDLENVEDVEDGVPLAACFPGGCRTRVQRQHGLTGDGAQGHSVCLSATGSRVPWFTVLSSSPSAGRQ